MGIKQRIQSIVAWVMSCDGETDKLLAMLRRHCDQNSRILDVGCGYGRNLRALRDAGFSNITGVEKNQKIVEFVRQDGYICFGLEDFAQSSESFDVILMSHVIEHFSPEDLLIFMDAYLDRLVPKGRLLIATPLLGDCFYDDFDHVKPYLPTGILHVFGQSAAQVQFYSRNRLELCDLWFRRGYHKFVNYRSAYLKTPMTLPLQVLNLLSALFFRASFGRVGKVDGWIGIFKKFN
jgi:SAM-dependent methyltransferase